MPETRKRVVLLHRSGLHRIIGVFDPSIHELHEFVEWPIRWPGGAVEQIQASLLQVQPRFVIYRQTMPTPATGKLGQFHPSQK